MGNLAEPRRPRRPALSPALERRCKVGLVLKSADDVVEIIGGLLLLLSASRRSTSEYSERLTV